MENPGNISLFKNAYSTKFSQGIVYVKEYIFLYPESYYTSTKKKSLN